MKNKLIIYLLMISAATAIGLYFQFFSNSIDSPVEQAAEEVLKANGIDIDFSESKKHQ